MHESAGKRQRPEQQHGNTWLTSRLVEVAGSVGRMEGANHLVAPHARLISCHGMARAQVAVAHSMLVSAYYSLGNDEPYAGTSNPTGSPAATARRTPAAWSPSSHASAERGPRSG